VGSAHAIGHLWCSIVYLLQDTGRRAIVYYTKLNGSFLNFMEQSSTDQSSETNAEDMFSRGFRVDGFLPPLKAHQNQCRRV
jgi:hypothetical protein